MTLLTTPERRRQRASDSRQKPGPKIADPKHYPCGHARSEANTVTRTVRGCQSKTCRTCENARQNKYRRAVHAAVKPAKGRHYAPVRKPWIVPQSALYAVLMAEAKAEYLRAIGEEPDRVPDSTDPAQLAADFGGEG